LKLIGIKVDDGDGNGGLSEYELWITPTGHSKTSLGYYESIAHSWHCVTVTNPVMQGLSKDVNLKFDLTEFDTPPFDPHDCYASEIYPSEWFQEGCAMCQKEFCINQNSGCDGFQVRFEISAAGC